MSVSAAVGVNKSEYLEILGVVESSRERYINVEEKAEQ
jgi:hypothetical protein